MRDCGPADEQHKPTIGIASLSILQVFFAGPPEPAVTEPYMALSWLPKCGIC